MAKPLPPGQILIDLRKNQWKLGPLIGQGGFGYLYLGEFEGLEFQRLLKFLSKIGGARTESHTTVPISRVSLVIFHE